MQPLYEAIAGTRVFDLAQPYFPGMPHHPTHPPFLFGLVKQHGDYVARSGTSSASEGSDAGWARGHAYRRAVPFFVRRQAARRRRGGVNRSPTRAGLQRHSVDTIAPILRRGVLLDIAGHAGGRRCPPISKSRLNILDAGRGRGARGRHRARRCSAAAHRMGALLRRCGALHLAGARARPGRERARAG